MECYLKPSAVRGLKKLPKDVRRRILDKLDFYARASDPLAFAETLKDRRVGDYRFRIGSYRVLFDVAGGKMIVLQIGDRRNIYR
jgi:mRNA interferase RelE/StbE